MENKNQLAKLPVNDDLYDIILLDSIDNARSSKDFSNYTFNDVPVPRVTKIIDSCMNREFLMMWAASLGKYGYLNEKDFATTIGTHVHEMIEHFLITGEDLDVNYRKMPKAAPVIDRAYNNFKLWYTNLINTGNTFELIATEVPVITPIYAGTIDCICKINNATYIIDFKTSKKISYEYIIQTCAYKWAVDNGYLVGYDINHIDGIGIIRIDKEIKKFDDLFLNEFIPEQNKILQDYIKGFMSILYTYYQKINMEYEFNMYKKSYTGLPEFLNKLPVEV